MPGLRLDLRDSENCWIKQVTGQYLAYSTVNIESANFTTVQECAYIDPKSHVSGGRRYSFAIQEGIRKSISTMLCKKWAT